MLKRTTLLALLLVGLSACKNDEPEAPTPTHPTRTEPAIAVDDKPGDTAAKPTDAKPQTPEFKSRANIETKLDIKRDKKKIEGLGKDYKQHLNAGRKLVKKRDYTGALASFDKALAIDPNDARALSEISWAAFLGKDLDRAEQAGRDSVRFSKDDKIKGASLYNLGRVAEERGQIDEAIRHYKDSLLVRENKIVRQRIAKLEESPDAGKGAKIKISDCGLTHVPEAKSFQDVCPHVADELGIPAANCKGPTDEDGSTWTVTHTLTPGDDIKTVSLATMYADSDFSEYVYIGIETSEGWFAMQATWIYNPGAFGIYEELTALDLNPRQLVAGGPTELLLEYKHDRSDSDMGIDEFESEHVDRVVAIGLDGDKPVILADLLRAKSYQRDRMGMMEEDEVEKDLQTEGLPIKNESGATVNFDGSGKVEVGAVKDQKSSHAAGAYSLGDAAVTKCNSRYHLW